MSEHERESLHPARTFDEHKLSRRELLKRGSVFAGGAALAALMAACGSNASTGGLTGGSPTASSGSTGGTTPTTASSGGASPSPTTATSGGATATTSTSGGAPTAGATTVSSPAQSGNSGNVHGVLTMSVQQTQAWTRNFNPFAASPLWPTNSAMHEPLMIYNPPQSKLVPWLATDYKWSSDNKTLTLTTRDGVKWSDGQPFSAKDVEFTFNLLKKNTALLGTIAWGEGLGSVKATSDNTVEFKWTKVFTPGLYDVVGQVIVPEHVWSKVKDPVKYTNPDPVVTGPFSQIAVFRNQIYEVDRNPNYWQKGKPYFKGLQFPAYTGNEQSNAAEISGKVDWFGDFIPNVQKTYISKDTDHFHFWWPSSSGLYLVMNTTKKPFDDPNVRKGISMALNREQMIKVALYGYTKVANPTGLSEYAYKDWISQKAVDAGKDLIAFDTNKANSALDKAGLKKGARGIRTAPDGSPMSYQLIVPSGWTDWIADLQVISNNLKSIGIDAKIKTMAADSWTANVQQGKFDMCLGWGDQGATPFNFYRGMMSTTTKRPVGQDSPDNWQRYANDEVTKLLQQFASTSDESQQRQIMDQIQMIFVKEFPVVPIYGQPDWGEYNTMHFTGFPNEKNAYAPLTPYNITSLIVLTTIKPV